MQNSSAFQYLAIDTIHESTTNPRRTFDEIKLHELVSRCTQFPESRLFVFNPFPGFDCIITALKCRTFALKTRTKFLLKFVRDISTKMPLSFLLTLVSVRDLSTNSSANSGN